MNITEDRMNELLEKSPAPRVTKELIESRISSVFYNNIGQTVTICSIVLDNGFSVRGESACVNVENYNKEIGDKIARDNAFNKLWQFFGFLLAEDQFRTKR